jgi:excisionase family DNA binding protein
MKHLKTSLPPEWESPGQSATVLGISRATVYNLIADGLLDARKLGERTIINVESRRKFAENLPKAEIATRKSPALPAA